jgi:hypothetical protein
MVELAVPLGQLLLVAVVPVDVIPVRGVMVGETVGETWHTVTPVAPNGNSSSPCSGGLQPDARTALTNGTKSRRAEIMWMSPCMSGGHRSFFYRRRSI